MDDGIAFFSQMRGYDVANEIGGGGRRSWFRIGHGHGSKTIIIGRIIGVRVPSWQARRKFGDALI
jgi:hypothetical protein